MNIQGIKLTNIQNIQQKDSEKYKEKMKKCFFLLSKLICLFYLKKIGG